MEACKSKILNGVEKFYKRGSPGNLVVFGEKAQVLITGDKEEDVVVAASEYGAGRVMAFSHDQYGVEIFNEGSTFDNSTFYENARRWVSNKENNIKMLFLKDSPPFDKVEDLKSFDIVINTGEEIVNACIMEQYVKEGGGFIQAFTPWGWLQLNPEKSIVDIPYSKLLNSIGIAFWNGVIYNDNLKINKTVISTDLIDRKSSRKQEEMKDLIYNAGFVIKLCKLPLDQCLTFKPAIVKIWEEVCLKVKDLCSSDRVCSKNRIEKITLDTWCNLTRLQENKAIKAPGIKHFPGDYDILPPRSCKSVAFTSTMKDIYVTSSHIPAGATAYLRVSSVKGCWKVILGAHTDCLTDDCCRRWPVIYREHEVDACKSYELTNPFGGSIYLLSPDDADAHIEANIDDVIFCPRYDIHDPRVWMDTRKEPGIWADLSGNHVTFTFPSESVRRIEDPKPVLELYDHLLEAYHELKGTDIKAHRRIWIVSDEQPSAGYMHAGYPIVTHLDVTVPDKEAFLLNQQSFLDGKFWGIFHEIGHNMQDSLWTFEGTSEVTVNIFTLYGMQVLCKKPILTHPWLKDQIQKTKKYLQSGANFEEWTSHPGIALYVYAQLAHHFGWDSYKQVFRCYNGMQEADKPQSQQDKIDLWFITFSRIVERDLTPWTDFWGIPISDAAKEKLKELNLEYHIPEDEISELDGTRLQNVSEAYSA